MFTPLLDMLVENIRINVVFDQSKLSKVYRQLLETLGPYQVWLVDGDYIRSNLVDDFTDFALHTDKEYPFIPKDEFWIDDHTASSEWPFYLANLWEWRKGQLAGLTDGQAEAKGNAKESQVRDKVDHVAQLKKLGRQTLVAGIRGDRIAVLDNGIQIYWANGRLVRGLWKISFTEAGHDLVYNFIPSREVWVDDAAFENTSKQHLIRDIHQVCVHELWERHLMETQKMTYLDAHRRANIVEAYVRGNPDQMKRVLGVLGWRI